MHCWSTPSLLSPQLGITVVSVNQILYRVVKRVFGYTSGQLNRIIVEVQTDS
jgi:hypothetical protein